VTEPVTADEAIDDPSGDADKGRRHSNFVQSLDRGLAVLRAFGPEHSQLTLSDVARATGLTRAAARRFLLTLVQLGYVTTDKRLFWLTPRVLELGFGYLSGLGLTEIAVPHMEELVATVQESSSIAVLDGDDIVYVVRVPTKRIMAVTITVGTRFPAYCTSLGRVLLSTLSQEALAEYLGRVTFSPLTERTITDPDRLVAALDLTRIQGYCVVDQELEDGLRSAAVPIVDATGTPFAALNVSVHASRVTLEELRGRYLTELRACAERINADLRAVGAAAGQTRVR